MKRLLQSAVPVILLVAACGGAGIEPASSTDASEDHQQELVEMENSVVASYLVPVAGYRYENITDVELRMAVSMSEEALSEGLFQAMSFHAVIADDPEQNTAQGVTGQMETGYFELRQLGAGCCPAGDEANIIRWFTGPAPFADQLEIANVPVFVFEQPESIDSRWIYWWIDHGTIGYFDGADRGPMERWLNQYLPVPKLAEHETPELSARLIVIPGFGYANVEPSDEFSALDNLSYAAHALVDSNGAIGALVLAQTDDATPLIQFFEGVEPDMAFEVTESEIGGYPVRLMSASDGSTILLWTQNGITGAIAVPDTNGLNSAKIFLEQFLAS